MAGPITTTHAAMRRRGSALRRWIRRRRRRRRPRLRSGGGSGDSIRSTPIPLRRTGVTRIPAAPGRTIPAAPAQMRTPSSPRSTRWPPRRCRRRRSGGRCVARMAALTTTAHAPMRRCGSALPRWICHHRSSSSSSSSSSPSWKEGGGGGGCLGMRLQSRRRLQTAATLPPPTRPPPLSPRPTRRCSLPTLRGTGTAMR